MYKSLHNRNTLKTKNDTSDKTCTNILVQHSQIQYPDNNQLLQHCPRRKISYAGCMPKRPLTYSRHTSCIRMREVCFHMPPVCLRMSYWTEAYASGIQMPDVCMMHTSDIQMPDVCMMHTCGVPGHFNRPI